MRALFLIISLVLASFAQAQSLDEYLKEAALNNPSLKAKYLGYEAALQKVPQVGGLPDPTLDFGFFASPVETRVGPQRANIRAMQMFPWFGTLGAQKDAATEMAKAKYELFINARNELFFDVQEVYYKVYTMDASIRLTEENIRILKSYERLALSRFENNQGGMIDVLRVQLETGELETQLINMRENRKPMVSKFNTLLSRNADAPLPMLSEMELRELTIDEGALIDSITSQNPTLRGLEHQKQASVNQSLAAKRNSAPSFGVGLSYTVVDKRTDMVVPNNGKDIWMPMLSIKLPIYRKRYKGQIQEQELLSQMYTQ
jgi:outer membrane protein, heavy metal efflux system